MTLIYSRETMSVPFKTEDGELLLSQNNLHSGSYYSNTYKVSLLSITLTCVFLPILTNICGIGFDIKPVLIPADSLVPEPTISLSTEIFEIMKGNTVHTILEWTAVTTAIITSLKAITRFKLESDPAIFVIGAALFAAGILDAFHVLASNKILYSSSNNNVFIPFTWALSRMFNASVMLVGPWLAIRLAPPDKERKQTLIPWLVALSFLALAGILMYWSATSNQIPQTLYPQEIITRPFDVLPLIIYCLAALTVLRQFYKKTHSIFAFSLIVSCIPQIIAQVYMSFFSFSLFDNAFYVAHFLKLVSYSILLCGLIMDNRQTQRLLQQSESALKDLNEKLETKVEQRTLALKESNKELQSFMYVASHDMKEPLRAIAGYASLLEQKYLSKLDAKGQKYLKGTISGAVRMQQILDDILELARVNKNEEKLAKVDLSLVVQNVCNSLAKPIEDSGATFEISDLPTVTADPTQMNQLFQNLISNAVKFKKPDTRPVVSIGLYREDDSSFTFSVADNGIGMDDEFFERIFVLFQRLHTRSEFEGTGIGLAICKKIVERHRGKIWCDSTPGKGTAFYFTLMKS